MGVELVEAGANDLAGAQTERIIDATQRYYGRQVSDNQELYGGGRAAQRIVEELLAVEAA